MPNTCIATVVSYRTPDEAAAVLATLLALLDGAQTSIRLLIYGFTDPQLIDAMAAASKRGVDVKCVFDHSQAVGATEALGLHRLLLTLPPANVRIGTSPSHGQLMHLKCLVVDGQTVAEGSLNWSPAARLQVNDLNVAVNADRAAWYTALFDEVWQFIDRTEPQYQKMPA